MTLTAEIPNLEGLFRVERGEMGAEDVRTVVVDDALADTGATRLALPALMIEQLGLRQCSSASTITADGKRSRRLHGGVQLTVDERVRLIDVAELPEGCPVVIWQAPLELMDWVVDLRN